MKKYQVMIVSEFWADDEDHAYDQFLDEMGLYPFPYNIKPWTIIDEIPNEGGLLGL